MSRGSKNIVLLVFAVFIYFLADRGGMSFNNEQAEYVPKTLSLEEAFQKQQSDVQIEGRGSVVKVLPDDLTGLKHQKFIVQVSPEYTVLIAHNIDVAERLSGLQEGDMVEFYGEYEWNTKGGVIHWTHNDPSGHHQSGWLKYNGKTYQ